MLNFEALNLKEEILHAVQDMGFTEAYLISEWQKAQREEFTPMCFDLCRRCGVCGEAQV